MQLIDFHTLTRSVQERFTASIGARVEPAPLLKEPLRSRAQLWWGALSLGAAAALTAFILRGFGDPNHDASLHRGATMLVYAALLSAIFLGVVFILVHKAERDALPYPRGVYVFPSSLVDARNGDIRVFPLSELTSVEGPRDGGATIDLVFETEQGKERFSFSLRDHGQAVSKARAVSEAMDECKAMRTQSDPRITLLFTLDPLQRPRISAPLGPRDPLGRRLPRWARLAWVIAPLAACIAAPVLRTARNRGSDERMFARTVAVSDAPSFRAYLAHGERHLDEVKNVLLPRAELREAEHVGTVEAIDDFAAAHPSSAIGDEIASARRTAMLAALESAKRTGTLAALQDFAKRHPDHGLAPELRAAIHGVFAPALEAFRKTPPKDPQARAFIERLFAYSEAKAQQGSTDTTVQIRFRRKPSRSLRFADKMVSEHHWFVGEASYPSRYFDAAHAQPREDEASRALAKRLGDLIGPAVFAFQEGARLDDADGTFPKVDVPTLFIAYDEDWQHRFDGSITKPRGVWVALTFDFEATFALPGDAQSLPFKTTVDAPIPMKVVQANPEGGTPQAPLEEKIYGAMASDAFGQFEARYVATFAP